MCWRQIKGVNLCYLYAEVVREMLAAAVQWLEASRPLGRKEPVNISVAWKLKCINTHSCFTHVDEVQTFLCFRKRLLWGGGVGCSNNSTETYVKRIQTVLPSVHEVQWKGTMVQMLALNSTRCCNMNSCCKSGSLLECFQHAWFHQFLWKPTYARRKDAAVMDSLIRNKWTRQGEKMRLRENWQSRSRLEHKMWCWSKPKTHQFFLIVT